MKQAILIVAILLTWPFIVTAQQYETVSTERATELGCQSCHEGIERFSDGLMHESIELIGADYGNPSS